MLEGSKTLALDGALGIPWASLVWDLGSSTPSRLAGLLAAPRQRLTYTVLRPLF